jgi:DNA-binding transcriptional MerR regulator
MAEPVEPLMPQLEEIPDKLYFRIGEVARLTGVKQYVLRFWENEFPGLGPKKSGTGHRLFRRKDVEMVLEIKRLLYDKRFTIEGARKALENKPKPQVVSKAPRSAAKAAALKAKAETVPAPSTAGAVRRVEPPIGEAYPPLQQQQVDLFGQGSLFGDLSPEPAAVAAAPAAMVADSRPAPAQEANLEPIRRELLAILELLR